MRIRTFLEAAGLIATLTSATALAEDGYRHGRVRFLEPGVTLQRATEATAEEAVANQPFLPGDRVWTDGNGRSEFQFPDGTVVRLDSRSKLDYSGHEEGREERIVLRLWSGSLVVRLRSRDAGRFEIETPAGTVEAQDQAMVRVDVDGGETRVSAYRGEVALDDGRNNVRLAEGQRIYARWGSAAEEPRAFDLREEDDFSRWDEDRDAEDDRAARSSEYLPRELNPYAGEFESNGSWRFEAESGYVWAPHVAAGWSPYSNGYWSWTPYGWTWIPNESWGWAPFHYGRWGFSVSAGWYWAPGRTWGPGWVSWGVGNGYVGWCPLGWRDRPVYAWAEPRGFAVARRGGGYGGWNVVRDGDFGHRNVAQRRVALSGLDAAALRVADSPNMRLTRDARTLRAANPETRAISRRPVPGDFVRELSVDNKYTIPAPWLREGRARGDATRSRDASDPTPSARARGEAGREAAGQRAPAANDNRASQEASAARARASRPAPWYAPRGRDDSASAQTAPPARTDSVRPEPSARSASPRRDEGRAERPQRDAGDRQGYVRETPRETPRAAPRESARDPERSASRESSRSRDDGGRTRSDASSARPDSAGSRPARETASPRGERSGSHESNRGSQSQGGGHGAARPPRGSH